LEQLTDLAPTAVARQRTFIILPQIVQRNNPFRVLGEPTFCRCEKTVRDLVMRQMEMSLGEIEIKVRRKWIGADP
jgi:hypothetical protein